MFLLPVCGVSSIDVPSPVASLNRTNSSGFSTGSDFSITVLTSVKIAVLAPMPSASVSTAIAAKPFRFNNPRSPYRMSLNKFSMIIAVPNYFAIGRAPEEQHVYSFDRNNAFAPLGATCHIALLRSAWDPLIRAINILLLRSNNDSLISQRYQRIDFRRASRRHVACNKAHSREQQRHQHKRQRIRRSHFEQQTPHRSRQRKRTRYSQHHANNNQRHSLPDHHQQHVAGTRAKRHVNANLTRTLRHRKREHAIQTDRSEYQRECSKHAQQN